MDADESYSKLNKFPALDRFSNFTLAASIGLLVSSQFQRTFGFSLMGSWRQAFPYYMADVGHRK
jgi:hypothetical protein